MGLNMMKLGSSPMRLTQMSVLGLGYGGFESDFLNLVWESWDVETKIISILPFMLFDSTFSGYKLWF